MKSHANSRFSLRLGVVFACCALLLAMNVGSAFLPLGRWHIAANLLLALGEASLLMLSWMHLRRADALTRGFVLVPFALLILLITMTLADTLTRQMLPWPWPQ
jgi:cytochrome c oxidase subunit 4